MESTQSELTQSPVAGAAAPPAFQHHGTGRTVSHYRLLDKVGTGGMGDVFRAYDFALGRDAAVKLVPPVFTADLRMRLLAEAEASARLQHPAIATFYEAGEADGEAFIAMEFVRGRTLRERLRNGPMSPHDALPVIRHVLEALVHAHAAGLLHRDIKPENIIVTDDGGAKLLDFGIAVPLRVRDAATFDTAAETIQSGSLDAALVGTIGYVAPEQLSGAGLDARTDVFQAGVVLYEMLAGRQAFPGDSPVDRLAALLLREPDFSPFHHIEHGRSIAAVLRRALASSAADRYPNASAFLRDVQGLSAAQPLMAQNRIIAVLDFADDSDDRETQWLGSALADGIRDALARAAGPTSVPRERIRRVCDELRTEAGATLDPATVGIRLGCGHVVCGSVRRSGSLLQVPLQLIAVATGDVVAAEQVSADLSGLFDLQARLTTTVAGMLDIALSREKSPYAGSPSEAYECYARARLAVQRITKQSLEEARELLDDAVRIQPEFADALGLLAFTHGLRSIWTTNAADLDEAIECAEQALAVEPDHVQALVAKGYALFRLDRLDEAAATLARAVELDPHNSGSHYFAGLASVFLGAGHGDGLQLLQRAVELDASQGLWWLALGTAHHLCRNDRQAALYCYQRAAELEGRPGPFATAGAAGYVAEILRLEGRLEEAHLQAIAGIEAAEHSDHAYRDTFRANALTVLGRIALDRGDIAAAEAAFNQVLAQVNGRPRARACGHFLVQAMAGLVRGTRQDAVFRSAVRLFENRVGYSFEVFHGAMCHQTLSELALAAESLGLSQEATRLHEAALADNAKRRVEGSAPRAAANQVG